MSHSHSTTATAQAIQVETHGGPEVMKLVSTQLGEIPAGHARVRHTAIGVNYIDTYHRSGLYPVPTPHGIGGEACGVVESVGEGVDASWVGRRVAYALGAPGSYSSHRDVLATRLVPVPDAISDEVAATAMIKGMTAWYLLKRVWPLQAGDTILVHAAAGGMGLYLTQWATHLGLRVLGTAGSAVKAALAKEAGAAEVILYREEDFAARVRELTDGEGVTAVLDGVGHDTFYGSLKSLKPRGILVTFGNASGQTPEFSAAELAPLGSLYVTRPSLFHYIADDAELQTAAQDVFEMLESGVLHGGVHLSLPLAEAAEVHRRLEARETTGASVLIP